MGVGLDIGTRSIKVVEIVKDGSNHRLRASGIVGYSGITPDHAKDDKEMTPLAESIKRLFKEAKIASKNVSIALPEAQVFTRTIKFPLLTDAEVASAVRWEAEQYIPIPIQEAIVQHQIVERRENTDPPQVVVLLVAAPTALVEKYQKLVEMAGLSLASVETELIALTRSLAPPDQSAVIVDIGARSTDIAIVKNQQLTLSRSISTAGEAFTRAVSQGLGIDENQAEEYKKTYGLSTEQLEGKIKAMIDPVFSVVVDEIRKAINYYRSDQQGEPPKAILLSGGTAGLPDLAIEMTRILGAEVVVGNPFSNIAVDPQSQKTLSGYAPFYSLAVGLALKEE